MPADGLAGVFHFDGETGAECAADEVVVADGVVAVELEVVEVDDERVSGLCTLDVEGAGFGIAAHHATDAFLVGAAGVDGGRVDGVAGIDSEDWLVEGRELAVEDSGGEVVALGRGVLERELPRRR